MQQIKNRRDEWQNLWKLGSAIHTEFYHLDFYNLILVFVRFGARGVAEARVVRGDPDTGSSCRPKSGQTTQLQAPTQANPGAKLRSRCLGQNSDPSTTLTLPNGPNLTQRSGELSSIKYLSKMRTRYIYFEYIDLQAHLNLLGDVQRFCSIFWVWRTPQVKILPTFLGTYLQPLRKMQTKYADREGQILKKFLFLCENNTFVTWC